MPARLAHVLVFVADHARVARFYQAVLGWPSATRGGLTVIGPPGGGGVALHPVPPEVLAPRAADAPLVWREDTALKPCFAVDDLAAARAAVDAHGGATREPWTWEGATHVDCADPEGNIFQLVG